MFAAFMNKANYNRLQTGLLCILMLVIALGLKYHYSRAGSEDLLWVLSPTAGLVEYLSSVRFEKVGNTGYVNHERHVIISPSCSGINFMIIVFCMTSFSGIKALGRSRLKNLWLGLSFLTAYILTIGVNAFRIIVSIHFYEARWFQSWGTAEMVHRIEGVFIYFTCLTFFYPMIGKIIRWIQHKTEKKELCFDSSKGFFKTAYITFIPVLWYWCLTIGVPLLNRAYQKGGQQFVEHSLAVLSVCSLVFVIFYLTQLSCKRLWIKIKCRRNG